MPDGLTRYASMTRKQASLILVCLCAFIAYALTVTPRRTLIPRSYNAEHADKGDKALYQRTIARIHAGEDYYSALGGVLRADGRPTTSVLNWRTPLHLTAMAFLPNLVWAQVILGGLAAFALILAFNIMAEGKYAALAALQTLLMLGTLLVCFTDVGLFFPEIWAGVLIAVSLGAYATRLRPLAIGMALLALFVRELALPYVLVCGLLAYRAKRRTETLVFTIGLVAYIAYFAAHVAKVNSAILVGDVANPAGWVQFGGVGFLLRATCVGWLMILPPWITAVYLPISVLGLAGWNHAVAQRALLTVIAYLAAFSIVGHSVNLYWGALYTPILTFGAAIGIVALYELIHAVLPDGKIAPKVGANPPGPQAA
jgi:hypothetical protein